MIKNNNKRRLDSILVLLLLSGGRRGMNILHCLVEGMTGELYNVLLNYIMYY